MARCDETPPVQRHTGATTRRCRSPTDVPVIGLAPIDPSWAPLVAWHPDPTILVHPVSVLTGGRTDRVVGTPKRPVVALFPIAVVIRDVVGVAWVEDRSVLGRVVPTALARKPLLEHLDGDANVDVGANGAGLNRDVASAAEHCDGDEQRESAHQTDVRDATHTVQIIRKNGCFPFPGIHLRGTPWNNLNQGAASSVRDHSQMCSAHISLCALVCVGLSY